MFSVQASYDFMLDDTPAALPLRLVVIRCGSHEHETIQRWPQRHLRWWLPS